MPTVTTTLLKYFTKCIQRRPCVAAWLPGVGNKIYFRALSQLSSLISHTRHNLQPPQITSHDRTHKHRRRTPVHAARMQVKSWRKSLENKLLSQRKGSEGETQHLRRLRHTSSTLLFLRYSVTQTGSTHTFCDNSRHFSTRGTRCRRSQVGSSRRGNRR